MSMKNITTIGSLLREVWRYEPDILNLIFKFYFIPVYENKENKIKSKDKNKNTKIKNIAPPKNKVINYLIH